MKGAERHEIRRVTNQRFDVSKEGPAAKIKGRISHIKLRVKFLRNHHIPMQFKIIPSKMQGERPCFNPTASF